MRAKQVDTSGRLDVGEAVEGGSVRDEAVSAAPLPPEDDEEGQPAQPLARPDRPTPEMVAAHEVSHLPYRSWCRACVAGRGRAFQHKASTQESTVPIVSMDYLCFNERADGSGLPTVVLRDRHSLAKGRLGQHTQNEQFSRTSHFSVTRSWFSRMTKSLPLEP